MSVAAAAIPMKDVLTIIPPLAPGRLAPRRAAPFLRLATPDAP